MAGNEIMFRLVRTIDGSGLYWAPIRSGGSPDRAALARLSSLGYPTDTDGWIEPAVMPGWYDCDSLGSLLFDMAEAGIKAVFLPGVQQLTETFETTISEAR